MKDYVIRFDKNENFLSKTIRILSIVIALFCLIWAIVSDVHYTLWMLPVIYSLGMVFLGNNNVVLPAPGIITLNVVMFCRYSLLPMVMYLTGEVSRFAKQYDYVQKAIFVMVFELICILLVAYITGRQLRSKRDLIVSQEKQGEYRELKYGNIVCIFLVALLLIMVMRYPYLLGGIKLLLQGYLDIVQDISDVSGVIGIFCLSVL